MSDIHFTFPLLFPILVGALGVTAGAATVGCSSSSDAAAPDRGDAGALEASSDTGPCVGMLESVRSTWGVRCGDTAAADFDAGASCGPPGSPSLLTSTCGGLDVVEYAWATHAQYCFYAADGGTLVGAAAKDDTPSFCASTSYAISAGPVLETVDAHEGTTTWSVSGQACAMAAPDTDPCAHDAGAD